MDITKEFSDVEQNLMERTDDMLNNMEYVEHDDNSDKEISVEEKVALTLEVE